jgi:hypothetical protein
MPNIQNRPCPILWISLDELTVFDNVGRSVFGPSFVEAFDTVLNLSVPGDVVGSSISIGEILVDSNILSPPLPSTSRIGQSNISVSSVSADYVILSQGLISAGVANIGVSRVTASTDVFNAGPFLQDSDAIISISGVIVL